jgi:hypothetical protein
VTDSVTDGVSVGVRDSDADKVNECVLVNDGVNESDFVIESVVVVVEV